MSRASSWGHLIQTPKVTFTEPGHSQASVIFIMSIEAFLGVRDQAQNFLDWTQILKVLRSTLLKCKLPPYLGPFQQVLVAFKMKTNTPQGPAQAAHLSTSLPTTFLLHSLPCSQLVSQILELARLFPTQEDLDIICPLAGMFFIMLPHLCLS